MRQTHASIDIGSNTLRLLIAQPSTDPLAIQPWKTVDYAHRITRLGQGLHNSGILSETGMERALDALQEFRRRIDHYDVQPKHIYAVATAAVREAGNGAFFKQLVRERTGIDVSIIDGEEEASRSLLGAVSVLHDETRKDMLLFDIGGGSTEFIRARDSTITDAISCRLGVVRLVEEHLHSDPPAAEAYMAMKESVFNHLAEVDRFWVETSPVAPARMVGTAGTVTTLAAVQMGLVPYDPQQVNNHRIERSAFYQLRDRLLAMNHVQRESVPGIETGRADLIIAGLAIIEAIMEKWNYDSFITVDAALLEGNWISSYAK
ncbi:MAG: Ppx/GppA phosphatase family protein [Mariprofundaceae bacterium]|nr:Ppx/GppA phosphatase family protein [Mariprofundaceae bacterium]